MSEFDWIAQYLSPLTNNQPGSFDLKNDAAVLMHDPGHDLVVTSDTLIESRHFLSCQSPQDLARKALRVNLSDLAAMGATPLCYTLNLALTKGCDKTWLENFVAGLKSDQEGFSVYLLGGDTTKGGDKLVISMTLFGSVHKESAWRRDGSEPGDYCFVTGRIGEAMAGLKLRTREWTGESQDLRDQCFNKYNLPNPRVEATALHQGCGVTAAIDVSDGLLADLGHICRHSNVAIDLQVKDLPIDKNLVELATSNGSGVQDLCSGGDDYELILSVKSEYLECFYNISRSLPFPFTNIGRFHKKNAKQNSNVRLFDDNGKEITPELGGWDHFLA